VAGSAFSTVRRTITVVLSSTMHFWHSRLAETFTLAGKRIFVAGHRGMVGSAMLEGSLYP
jgi:hypothetical protein